MIENKLQVPATWIVSATKKETKMQYHDGNFIKIIPDAQDKQKHTIIVDTEFQLQPKKYEIIGDSKNAFNHAVCLATEIDIMRDDWKSEHLQKFGFNNKKEFAVKKYNECIEKMQLKPLEPLNFFD